ncbi:hypothetical protein BSLA_02f2196 [Burkholderia stabilis]|nr:hypothetical protein BSLA_02f2196 [Burkholderia stabilis]
MVLAPANTAGLHAMHHMSGALVGLGFRRRPLSFDDRL